MRFTKSKIVTAVVLVIFVFISYVIFLSSPKNEGEAVRLVIPLKSNGESVNLAVSTLREEGLIKSRTAFTFVLGLYGLGDRISPGAYLIEPGLNAFALASELKHPDERWVIIPEGLRKEEIAEIFADTFSWSDEEKEKWITKDTTNKTDYTEGVYFPDTYLIPISDSPEKIAERMITRFNEKFAPYAEGFAKDNVRWPTALKIASIVQREAGGPEDMPIIAGVLWNRLLDGMKLDIDATLQYARGDEGKGWWAPITKDDKKTDSPYNTYLYAGLPPTPISNPGIKAIEAVLHPAKTKCLFYLHDNDRQIHCAATYDEHLDNIEKYLK